MARGKPEPMRLALELIRKQIADDGTFEARPLFEVLATVLYTDPLDSPALVPVLDEALSLMVGFGDWVIPALVQRLDAGDLKLQMAAAHALGRIGADAIHPLVAEYRYSVEASRRAFVLYALGKIRHPGVVEAIPLSVVALGDEDMELRDTATRALGKFAEVVPPERLTPVMCREMVAGLRENLADTNPGIRAKAVRSLGKLARFGHLGAEERAKLRATLELILGEDDHFEWDRAYIVRREAREALEAVDRADEEERRY